MKNFVSIIFICIIIFIISGCDTTEPVFQVQAVVINAAGTGILAVSILDLSGDSAVEVKDATVTVNDVTVPYDPVEGYTDSNGSLGITLSEGANVHLTVETGELSLSENVSVPETPVVTAPVDSSIHDADLPITVTWNAFDIEPDEIWLRIESTFTTSGNSYDVDVASDATSYQIPGNTMNNDQTDVYILVHSLNVLDLEGNNLSSSSVFSVGNQGVSGGFDTSAVGK